MSCACKLPPLKTVGPTTGHLRICVQLYCCCRHLTEVLSKGICALVLRLTALVAAVSPIIDHGLHRLLTRYSCTSSYSLILIGPRIISPTYSCDQLYCCSTEYYGLGHSYSRLS
eukprot:COSAG01_NODE_67_length_29188_cov_1135.609474_36_plen_114_part_00